MLLRTIVFLMLGSVRVLAQGADAAFAKALDEELANRSNGKWLYGRSDVYKRMVLHHIAEKLHIGTANNVSHFENALQDAQHFLGDVSNDQFGQEETSVAISRNDPNRILIVSNDEAEDVRSMPVYLSTDAGMSWNTSRMPSPPKPYTAYGDPFVTADTYNGFYYAFLIADEKEYLSNLIVAFSPDGISWTYGNPVIANKTGDASLEDKESIAVDRTYSSPTFGRIYISWEHSDGSSPTTGLQLAWSDDKGASWSIPVRIDSGQGFFSQVKVDRNGTVFYTFSQYHDDGAIAEHYLLVSHDHGATFTRRKIADYYNYPYSKSQLAPVLKGANGIRGFPYITIEYDMQSSILHAVYGSYKKWNDSLSTAVLYYTNSKDEGKNWSPPVAIGYNGDSVSLQTDRFMPWIGVDTLTGNVHIVYYSSQNDPQNNKLEAYRMILYKEGNIDYTHLSDSLFDPLHVTDYTPTPFIGDYNGCDISGSTFAYAWTENRKGLPPHQYFDGEVYAFVNSIFSDVPEIRQVSAHTLSIFSAYPNPVSEGKLRVGFAIPENGPVTISLLSENGSLCVKLFAGDLASGTYEKDFTTDGLPSGEYFISVKTGYGVVEKKILIVH